MYTAKHMKWWGWGDEGVSFDSGAHPGLWPYAKAVLGVEEENSDTSPVPIEAAQLRIIDSVRQLEGEGEVDLGAVTSRTRDEVLV